MLRYLKPYMHLIGLSMGLSIVIVTSESLSLWFAGSLIKTLFMPQVAHMAAPAFSLATINDWLKYKTYLLVSHRDVYQSLAIVCLLVLSMFFLKNLFTYIKSIVLARINAGIVSDLRNSIYSNALKLPVSYYDRNRSGNIISLVLNDVNAVNNAMVSTFDKLFIDPFRIIFFVTTLFIISPKLALTVLITYPVFGVLIGVIGKTVRRRSRRLWERMEGITSVLHETVNCIRAVKMFNMSGVETKKFALENAKFVKINVRTASSVALTSPLTETLGVLVTVILLWVGGREVLAGNGFGAEDFIRFLTFLFMMFQPLKSLGNVNNTIQNGLAAAQRIFAIVDVAPEPITVFSKQNVPAFERELRFEHVRFSYPECTDEVLRDISFTLKKGEIVAIVGSSGSGKSTILDLMPRFYDITGGTISIDNNDIRTNDLVGLRHLFGIVAQETILFNDTIHNNISYGLQDASEEKVIAAARAANAWEFIERMPDGLQTIIGERGVMLSGGQRQRLSIARAILKNPEILILDEATSALDTESERLVQEAINTLMSNRTVVVVAHRLSTVTNADKIIVLENGEITEQGTHEQLLGLNGRYTYFFNMQFAIDGTNTGKV
jgi:subfamily B ATP-binding cassette protein MsbA